MRPLSPVLASLANVFRIPLSKTPARPAISRLSNDLLICKPTAPVQPAAAAVTAAFGTRTFSTTSALLKRSKNAPRGDKRITLIRYFLWHPLTPRPLRFSRTRYLRHWTIHRAWQLYQAQQRRARQLELQRQWQAMYAACEELRTGAGDGGKLFRISMNKRGVYRDMFPIEYGRMQTEGPSKEGWNHEWKRMEKKY
ncbi:54S ribosomal protein L28, mitochondrial [Aspergillus udagawae]|uniref:54S ribosomal protein L28, mitochondrial n=1 Tax=Aspergillus udagawae TaxID=91492 RepID=A0ABQ1AUR5_9EURO|nr:54S ribosomal protein L28, mitochondrial [Aspergillus udagawae]GFF88391.1 54S ribosomal protein L28, mitochondrial [Aspergillus udagawae]GFG03848.1 54S ribosomal protein L28, mitochondrial [Aspergillus udagawae]GFG21080.1 54S ribosomal protein L28, mitochondrial [Aspergillus udagawae]